MEFGKAVGGTTAVTNTNGVGVGISVGGWITVAVGGGISVSVDGIVVGAWARADVSVGAATTALLPPARDKSSTNIRPIRPSVKRPAAKRSG